MDKRQEPIPFWLTLVLILALVTLLGVVAIGAQRIPSAGGDSQLPLDSRVIGQIVAYVTWAILAVVLVWLMLPGGGRRRRKVRPKRGSWLATALVLIALLVVFMQLGKLSPEPTGEEEATVVSLPEVRDTTVVTAESGVVLPAGSTTTLWIVVAAVFVTVAALGAIGRTRGPGEEESPPEPPAFREVIDDLLADLEGSGDPRLIVIGAYARMEQALATDGIARRRAEAPLEFLDRALRHLEVSAGAVRHLTDLFTEARFSPHVIDEDMSLQAIEALQNVRDELRIMT